MTPKEILQEMGCNGIRCSHNPPAPELLDLCDRMGFIVMDQTFDNGIVTINTETCEALGLDLDTVKEAFKPYCTAIVEVTTAENFS